MGNAFRTVSGSVSAAGSLLAALVILGAPYHVRAQTPQAAADFSGFALGGGEYQYTITLEDTGTTDIGTFWNAWVPGKNFMAVSPTNIVTPTGWEEVQISHGSDGYGIEWEDPSNPGNILTPGNSLQFGFDSTSTPSDLGGNTTFYSSPTFPVETSFVYIGNALVGNGYELVVQPVAIPEPSAAGLQGFGAMGLLWAGWRRRSWGLKSSHGRSSLTIIAKRL